MLCINCFQSFYINNHQRTKKKTNGINGWYGIKDFPNSYLAQKVNSHLLSINKHINSLHNWFILRYTFFGAIVFNILQNNHRPINWSPWNDIKMIRKILGLFLVVVVSINDNSLISNEYVYDLSESRNCFDFTKSENIHLKWIQE